MKFVIIGLGQFGKALAMYLSDSGFEVTVLDQKESVVEEIRNHVADAQIGDATDIRALRRLDLQGDDTYVIVAVGECFERNILITAQLKELGVKNLYARSVNELHGKVLKLIGVSDLFRVEDVAAKQLAARFVNEGLMRLRKIDATHSLADVRLPDDWVGRTLQEVNMRKQYHINLLTVRRGKLSETSNDDVLLAPEQPVIDTPDPGMKFQEGDVLVIFGKDGDLTAFVKKFNL
ncbi:MAG: TrkA family potassium uptake protein [Akkermansia sp.]|nr:TrkA family potassium uptake protein [Akkermansia sp.]